MEEEEEKKEARAEPGESLQRTRIRTVLRFFFERSHKYLSDPMITNKREDASSISPSLFLSSTHLHAYLSRGVAFFLPFKRVGRCFGAGSSASNFSHYRWPLSSSRDETKVNFVDRQFGLIIRNFFR